MISSDSNSMGACGARSSVGRFFVYVMAAALIAGVGCSSTLETTRRHTYAPTFNYITDQQLESAMWQLAEGIRHLDETLGTPPVLPQQQLDVLQTIEGMEQAASRLGPEGLSSNHPRITHNLGRFREQLAIARRAVSVDPPSYYLAGRLSGTCLACHAGE
jgi:hypothetical protein